jgi:hypothetical protein
MDPFMERPDRWGGVHTRLIAVIGELLTQQVAPRFFVDSEDNVYILGLDDPARSLVRPDLYTVEAAGGAALPRPRGSIAAATVLELPPALEVYVPYVKVVDTMDRHVVAIVELLSPINKAAGSMGQREFLRKRERMLGSSTHWLEIDLLREGSRPPGIPSQGDYEAALHRAGAGGRWEAWFMALREPLLTIAVPLRPPFDDVPLDLQQAVDIVYDRYRYDVAIDYDEQLPAPLREDDSEWASQCVARWQQTRAPQS